jgi:SET domain
MIIVEDDERFFVNRSTISRAGHGLFAKTSLGAGARLEVIGVLVPAGSLSDLCTRYADCYKFRVGDLLLIPLGYGAMVNHSARPNMEKVVEGRKAYLRTTRPIDAGEELFFGYGEEFFKVTQIHPDSFASEVETRPEGGQE